MRLALILGLVGLIATQQLQRSDAFRLLGTGKNMLSSSPLKALRLQRSALKPFSHTHTRTHTRSTQWRVHLSGETGESLAVAVAAEDAQIPTPTETHTHAEAAAPQTETATATEVHAHTHAQTAAEVDMDLVVSDTHAPDDASAAAPVAVPVAVGALDASLAHDTSLSADQQLMQQQQQQVGHPPQQFSDPSANYVQNEFSVFVGKLPFAMTEALLDQAVRQRLGEQCAVESVKLVTNKYTGRSKGFGYVNFANRELTELGAQLLKGLAFDNIECHVDVASYPNKDGRRELKPRGTMQPGMPGIPGMRDATRTVFGTQRRTPEEEEMRSRCSVHVSNVPGGISTDQLKSEFEAGTGFSAQEITMFPPMPNSLTGFCFVRLNSEEEVAKLLEKTTAFTLSSGEKLEMKRSIFREREYSVFIGNLPFGADDGLMRDMFHDVLGENRFKRVYVGKDQFGRSRGFAFGFFDNAIDAKNAIAMINGMELLGRVLRAEKGSNIRKPRPFDDSRGDNFQGGNRFDNGLMPAGPQFSG